MKDEESASNVSELCAVATRQVAVVLAADPYEISHNDVLTLCRLIEDLCVALASDSAERASTAVAATEIAETLRGVPCKNCQQPWDDAGVYGGVAVHNVICRFVPDFERQAEAVRALYASREEAPCAGA